MNNVCVECGEAVDSLFVKYSGGHVRLTRCNKCDCVADKYVEFELILVAMVTIINNNPYGDMCNTCPYNFDTFVFL